MKLLAKLICIFNLVLFTSGIASADIYKWVDDNGITHYSDQPHAGAKEVQLPKIEVYSPPPQVQSISPSIKGKIDKGSSFSYKTFSITTPPNESTIRDNQGIVSVELEVSPALRKKDKVQLYLDKKKLGKPQSTTSFTLQDVYRGTHILSAEVVDAGEKSLIKSQEVTFYMFRAIIPQNRPN